MICYRWILDRSQLKLPGFFSHERPLSYWVVFFFKLKHRTLHLFLLFSTCDSIWLAGLSPWSWPYLPYTLNSWIHKGHPSPQHLSLWNIYQSQFSWIDNEQHTLFKVFFNFLPKFNFLLEQLRTKQNNLMLLKVSQHLKAITGLIFFHRTYHQQTYIFLVAGVFFCFFVFFPLKRVRLHHG